MKRNPIRRMTFFGAVCVWSAAILGGTQIATASEQAPPPEKKTGHVAVTICHNMKNNPIEITIDVKGLGDVDPAIAEGFLTEKLTKEDLLFLTDVPAAEIRAGDLSSLDDLTTPGARELIMNLIGKYSDAEIAAIGGNLLDEVSKGGHFSHLDDQDMLGPCNPVGDTTTTVAPVVTPTTVAPVVTPTTVVEIEQVTMPAEVLGTVVEKPAPTTAPAAAATEDVVAASSLARTGADTADIIIIGFALWLVGMIALVGARLHNSYQS